MKDITGKTLLRYAMRGKVKLCEKDALEAMLLFSPDQLEVNMQDKHFTILGWNSTFYWGKVPLKANKEIERTQI